MRERERERERKRERERERERDRQTDRQTDRDSISKFLNCVNLLKIYICLFDRCRPDTDTHNYRDSESPKLSTVILIIHTSSSVLSWVVHKSITLGARCNEHD